MLGKLPVAVGVALTTSGESAPQRPLAQMISPAWIAPVVGDSLSEI
jgi:hypothetical protein